MNAAEVLRRAKEIKGPWADRDPMFHPPRSGTRFGVGAHSIRLAAWEAFGYTEGGQKFADRWIRIFHREGDDIDRAIALAEAESDG